MLQFRLKLLQIYQDVEDAVPYKPLSVDIFQKLQIYSMNCNVRTAFMLSCLFSGQHECCSYSVCAVIVSLLHKNYSSIKIGSKPIKSQEVQEKRIPEFSVTNDSAFPCKCPYTQSLTGYRFIISKYSRLLLRL